MNPHTFGKLCLSATQPCIDRERDGATSTVVAIGVIQVLFGTNRADSDRFCSQSMQGPRVVPFIQLLREIQGGQTSFRRYATARNLCWSSLIARNGAVHHRYTACTGGAVRRVKANRRQYESPQEICFTFCSPNPSVFEWMSNPPPIAVPSTGIDRLFFVNTDYVPDSTSGESKHQNRHTNRQTHDLYNFSWLAGRIPCFVINSTNDCTS